MSTTPSSEWLTFFPFHAKLCRKRGEEVKIKELSLCGLFAALLAICAWFSLPVLGIPVTLQTFALFLALFTLGGRRGLMAISVYLLLGAVGLPVFSGFGGGIGVLFGPTGGFLWGFVLTGALYWYLTGRWNKPILAAFLGMLLCYFTGICWFILSYGSSIPFTSAFFTTIAPFLLPDGLKIFLAWVLSRRLRRHIN